MILPRTLMDNCLVEHGDGAFFIWSLFSTDSVRCSIIFFESLLLRLNLLGAVISGKGCRRSAIYHLKRHKRGRRQPLTYIAPFPGNVVHVESQGRMKLLGIVY